MERGVISIKGFTEVQIEYFHWDILGSCMFSIDIGLMESESLDDHILAIL